MSGQPVLRGTYRQDRVAPLSVADDTPATVVASVTVTSRSTP